MRAKKDFLKKLKIGCLRGPKWFPMEYLFLLFSFFFFTPRSRNEPYEHSPPGGCVTPPFSLSALVHRDILHQSFLFYNCSERTPGMVLIRFFVLFYFSLFFGTCYTLLLCKSREKIVFLCIFFCVSLSFFFFFLFFFFALLLQCLRSPVYGKTFALFNLLFYKVAKYERGLGSSYKLFSSIFFPLSICTLNFILFEFRLFSPLWFLC